MKALCIIASVLLLSACAGVPKNQKEGIKTERELSKVREERNASMQKFVNVAAVESARSLGLPSVKIADGVINEKITQGQADLVSNRAGREVCKDLANYFEMRETDTADLKLQIIVTAINPTNAGASGASSVVGVFVPGPFRLPIGLGGLAVDGSAEDLAGKQMIVTKWAKGANSFTNDAKVSSIGDAYQLAAGFAEAFSKLLINPGNDKKVKRVKLTQLQIDNNKNLCEIRFGKASVAGRGASLLLPLAPEAYDSGAPKRVIQEKSETSNMPLGAMPASSTLPSENLQQEDLITSPVNEDPSEKPVDKQLKDKID
jgi:hypothetical protein